MIDDFDLLVERCTLRRRKQMIRFSLCIVGTILLTLAAISGYTLWFSSGTSEAVIEPSPKPQESMPAAPLSAPLKESKTAETQVPKKPILPVAPVASITTEKIVSAPPYEMQKVADKQPIAPLDVPSKSQSSRFFEVNTEPKSSPADPISAYNANPKYETALAVARDFYTQKEFSEAAVWAKKANQMNRESEEAWLLYAKSYHAQGRKNEAIGVLELFLNYKDSKAASELLRTWKQTPSN